MPQCPVCGNHRDPDQTPSCPHHSETSSCIYGYNHNWGHHNAIWCDFFHRQVELPRLWPEPMNDEVWTIQLPYCFWPLGSYHPSPYPVS